MSIPAPAGWKTQTRANGATTFTPPDLHAGEKYSVTVYDSAPLNGQSLEAYLRTFAGSVGTKPGQLGAPLKIETREGKVVSGVGAYVGPNGAALGVLFIGTSPDGANVHVARILFSDGVLLERYADRQGEIAASMGRRAVDDNNQGEVAPSNLPEGMKIGGEMVPGVYAGTQFKAGMFGSRSSLELLVYIYPNGEYRICDQHDEDFNMSGPVVGRIKYNRARGTLDIEEYFALSNDNFRPGKTYCFYGRSAEGKLVIFGRSSIGATTSDGFTRLIWQGPPTGRVAQSMVDAPAKLAKARRDAIQTTVAPGRGVPASQVAALVHHFKSGMQSTLISPGGSYIIPNFGGVATYGYNAPIYGLRNNITDDTYLLLRDGTVYRGLTPAPDQFDARASRQKEPENWGLWKMEGGKPQMSFEGKPYEPLPGKKAIPGTAQTRLLGRYHTLSTESVDTRVIFTQAGRFKRSAPVAGEPDASAPYTLVKAQKTVPGGDLAGTYSVSGYALTLRYDNGKVERMRFFFEDEKHNTLWFEGRWLVRDERD